MATVLGTVYLNGCNYQLQYDLLSQNINNNSSVVRLYGILSVTNSYVSWSLGTANVHTYSAGIGTYYSKGTYTLVSKDFTFTHKSDGTFSEYINASLSTTFVSGSTRGTLNLPRIPRQANIVTANNFNDEQNPYMIFKNDGGFQLNARLEFAGISIQRTNISNTGNYTFNLTESEKELLLSKCLSSNSLTVKYVIATKLNETETWWSFVDRTMTVVNANPIFTTFEYEDTNTTTKAITGNDQVLIKGYSTLRTTIPSANKMVAKKQANAKNYGASIDSRNSNVNYATTDVYMDLGTILSAGTKRLSVRAYDTRNNSVEVYKDITVYDYNAPIINTSIQRLNNFEAQTTLKVNGSYTPLNISGSDKNTIATTGVQYRYRESGGTWGSWTNLTRIINASAGTFNCTDEALTLDNTKSWEFEVRCIDKITTTTLSVGLDVGIPPFFISSNKKAVGVNCIPPSDARAGSIWSNGSNIFDLIYPIGSIYMSVNSVNPSVLFGGNWEQIAKGRTLVGVDTSQNEFSTSEKTGGAKTHTLTVNEMPIHIHGIRSVYAENGNVSVAYGSGGKWSVDKDTSTYPAGDNLPHNNLQPYFTCYIWLKTSN